MGGEEDPTAIATQGRPHESRVTWQDVKVEIERRNPRGYDKAASLLFDLRALADERGTMPEITRRLAMIRDRLAGKGRFLERRAGIE